MAYNANPAKTAPMTYNTHPWGMTNAMARGDGESDDGPRSATQGLAHRVVERRLDDEQRRHDQPPAGVPRTREHGDRRGDRSGQAEHDREATGAQSGHRCGGFRRRPSGQRGSDQNSESDGCNHCETHEQEGPIPRHRAGRRFGDGEAHGDRGEDHSVLPSP